MIPTLPTDSLPPFPCTTGDISSVQFTRANNSCCAGMQDNLSALVLGAARSVQRSAVVEPTQKRGCQRVILRIIAITSTETSNRIWRVIPTRVCTAKERGRMSVRVAKVAEAASRSKYMRFHNMRVPVVTPVLTKTRKLETSIVTPISAFTAQVVG